MPAFISVVKRTKQKSKQTPTALSSASQTRMMSSKEATKLIKSPPSFQERVTAGGETWCNHLYTVCESTLHREILLVKPPDAWGLWRWEEGVGGLLEKGWRQQQRMFIISHTRAHAQCYRHISPDSYDEPRQFMQKIVSFPQPHFSSNGFLSQFHPPSTPDICLPRIPPSSMSTFLWCSLSCSPPSSIPPSTSIT